MRQMGDPTADRFRLVLIVSLSSGLLFTPSLLAFVITGGKGTIILTQLLAGLVMGIITPYFGDMIFSNLLTGLLAELTVFAITRYEPITAKSAFGIGISLAILASVGSLIGHGALGLSLGQSAIIGILTLAFYAGLTWGIHFLGSTFKKSSWATSVLANTY